MLTLSQNLFWVSASTDHLQHSHSRISQPQTSKYLAVTNLSITYEYLIFLRTLFLFSCLRIRLSSRHLHSIFSIMPSITKVRISSPLEAGPSLLDAKQLPLQLTAALDYVSSRLTRKRLHLSLIVVRKDIQIPQSPSPQPSPKRSESPGHSITTSPAKSLFGGSAFTRTPSKSSLSSMSDSSSSTSSSASTTSLSHTNWPGLPTSPADRTVTPPPSTPAQPTTPTTPNPYGITLMHASTLTAKAEKILRHTIAKAEKKFSIGYLSHYLPPQSHSPCPSQSLQFLISSNYGYPRLSKSSNSNFYSLFQLTLINEHPLTNTFNRSGWLSPTPLTTSNTCPLTNDLIHRSLTQNEVIFSSEGLTLLSLDHVYTFKCHLHTYSRTLTPSDLTAAVDELRRLVLAQNGRRITKGYLMRAYEWLGVSLAALVDVNEGYKVAYGGKERFGGIEVQNEERKSPPPLNTTFAVQEIKKLRLNMNFDACSFSGRENNCESTCSEDAVKTLVSVDVGESAKGKDTTVEELREDRGPHRRGPMTPNGFEDITPVTKGEWCFLMVGEGWKEAKTAPVETC